MATLTIRLDDAVERALAELTRDGRTRSDAARAAILAAGRHAKHASLRAEAQALRHDAEDVAASRELAAEMQIITASGRNDHGT